MDLDLLEDFISVLQHGSILAAAEAKGRSQPTLSRRMRELEDSLGVLLLNRTSRGITPTVYGKIFQQHAEQMLRDHQIAVDDIRALKQGTHGHARIGMAPAFSGYLPSVIRKHIDEQPGLSFDVVDGTFDTLVEKTLKGEIDGAFTMLPPGESLESLAVTSIGKEPIVVVVDRNHVLAGSPAVSIGDLEDELWIVMNRPRSILEAFHQLASERGLTSPKVVIETSSLDFLKSSLRGSSLLALLPQAAVQLELADGTFKMLDVEGLPIAETVFVHRHGVLPPLVLQLVHEVGRVARIVPAGL
jgi:DNA-binding transcriptional LysR family regulator